MTDLQAQLRAAGDAATAAELEPLVNFIDETQRNLDLAKPAANAIRAPIVLDVTARAPRAASRCRRSASRAPCW